jgi:hypothetical protein
MSMAGCSRQTCFRKAFPVIIARDPAAFGWQIEQPSDDETRSVDAMKGQHS